MARGLDLPDLVERARKGEPLAVSRLISLVDTDRGGHERLRAVAAALAPHTGHAHVVGLTGPPGVGKSTTTSALVAALRKQGRTVGVLAVDPSSPFSGGALLGDRVRMSEHATDDGVFIRSMATRGHLGGLAWATPQALRVLDAAGFDVVLVETVGVGQSEIDVVALADTTVVMLAPGMGDGIQAAKAGILEIGDLFVVNKADREGAAQTVRDLRHMLSLGREDGIPDASGSTGTWRPAVMKTVAARNEGIDRLVEELDRHRGWIDEHGVREQRRRDRAAAEIEAIAVERVRVRIGDLRTLADLAARVAEGALDPYAAADELERDTGEPGLRPGPRPSSGGA